MENSLKEKLDAAQKYYKMSFIKRCEEETEVELNDKKKMKKMIKGEFLYN